MKIEAEEMRPVLSFSPSERTTATEPRPQHNSSPSWKICPRTGRTCFGRAQDLCGRKFSCWLGAGPVVQRERP